MTALYKIVQSKTARLGSMMPDATVTHTATPRRGIVLPARALSFGAVRPAIQDYIQQRIMDSDLSVVFDVTQLAESGHELVNARARGADHVSERLLGDRYGDHARLVIEPGTRQRHKNPRQPLLARIEQLVDQVRL
jgi:hypothetical protein